MTWLKDPVGVPELDTHMMRLYARDGVRGIFISTSDFTEPAILDEGKDPLGLGRGLGMVKRLHRSRPRGSVEGGPLGPG